MSPVNKCGIEVPVATRSGGFLVERSHHECAVGARVTQVQVRLYLYLGLLEAL
jgi:hypothetical protein